ncbi:MAG: alpha/beta hydrolase [Pseudomonadota bacterium]
MSRKYATLNGVKIAYIDEGEGDPILLIHGFASSITFNWIGPGWVKALLDDGRRVIAIDNRGHGQSDKFYEPERYEPDLMAADSIALVEHLGLKSVDVMGYSMGARLLAFFALARSDLVNRVIFGGLGERMISGVGRWQEVAAALEADDPATVTDQGALAFRKFADQTGSDRMALAACIRPSRKKLSAEDVSKIVAPALVAVGETDEVGGTPEGLADHLPNGIAYTIPGRDHMKAVGDKAFKQAVLAFLNNQSE